MASDPTIPHRRRSRLALLALGAFVFLALMALGTWQVQRLFWKLDLIERVEQRLKAEPTTPPGPDAWGGITAAADEYSRLSATGTFLLDKTTFVQAVTGKGAGFWVMTPLRTAQGIILVNRGFIPAERRRSFACQGEASSEITVTGLLRLSEPGGAFLRQNDPGAGRWYSRDVAAMAAALGLGIIAPYFIDAAAGTEACDYPVGGLTVVSFRNDHLVYAATWYTLAAMLAGAGFWVIRDARRRRISER
jgi:surfeit locus 1 family protein